jgi:hypothetical protein
MITLLTVLLLHVGIKSVVLNAVKIYQHVQSAICKGISSRFSGHSVEKYNQCLHETYPIIRSNPTYDVQAYHTHHMAVPSFPVTTHYCDGAIHITYLIIDEVLYLSLECNTTFSTSRVLVLKTTKKRGQKHTRDLARINFFIKVLKTGL